MVKPVWFDVHRFHHRGLDMAWICRRCGSTFDEPDSVRYCVDEYNGTQGLFGNWQYAYYEACPECGSEDIAHIYEDDESEEDEEWED